LSFAADILQKKIEPIERAQLIAKISRYKDQGITVEVIKGEFLRLNEEVLVKQSNQSLYNECADIVVNNGAQDVELEKEIRYIQYYEIGRANYNQGNYSLAKYFFAKALKQQPNNAELGATFLSTLALTMRQKKDEAGMLDTVLLYRKKFPSLQNNQNFNSLTANAFLVAASLEMDNNKFKLAEEHVKNFEEMYAQNSDLIIDSNVTGNTYSKLCSYYFKNGQKEKARALVKKGLEIAPGNYELRVRQQMIN
jgi:tetratricopeptide (TPR) repeat protein